MVDGAPGLFPTKSALRAPHYERIVQRPAGEITLSDTSVAAQLPDP